MIKLYKGGAYLLNGTELVEDTQEAAAKLGHEVDKSEAAKETIAYGILEAHNTSSNMERLKIKFDKLTSQKFHMISHHKRNLKCKCIIKRLYVQTCRPRYFI